jgi:RES domain
MCLDSEAPFAEMLRHEDLRTEREAATYMTSIWQLRVEDGYIVDYGTFDKAEAGGFPPEALVDDDHERCQAEAQRLISLGARGVVTPSAALPGSTNLTLFGPRVPIEWNAKVTIAATIPVQIVATGHPPSGLVDRVRFFGDAHPELEKFLAARQRRHRKRR